jgi:hypothetical protein
MPGSKNKVTINPHISSNQSGKLLGAGVYIDINSKQSNTQIGSFYAKPNYHCFYGNYSKNISASSSWDVNASFSNHKNFNLGTGFKIKF